MKRGHNKRRGFTLLEVVIAMILLGLLTGMIFSTFKSSMSLSNAIVTTRQEETEKAAFLALLQRHFENLPGNAILDLRWQDVGTHYLSTMSFQEVPMTFNWGGRIFAAEAIQIVTEKRADGLLDVVLKFYEEEVLDTTSDGFLDVKPSAEITLLEDVHRFEWQVVDSRTMEPTNSWDIRGRRPLRVLLNVIFEPQADEVLHTFWITPKVNPATYQRQSRGN